jgi:hypothetical protein
LVEAEQPPRWLGETLPDPPGCVFVLGQATAVVRGSLSPVRVWRLCACLLEEIKGAFGPAFMLHEFAEPKGQFRGQDGVRDLFS